MTALTAAPSFAGTGGGSITEGDKVSEASASAFNLSVSGQAVGSGVYLAVNNGALEKATGVNSPTLPLLGKQEIVTAGVLGQDAMATADGYSAACAGVVGGDGTLKLGPDRSCIVSGDGKVEISLGTLDALGLSTLLGGQVPGLPELPAPDVPELPAPDLPVPDLPTDELPVPDLPTDELPVPDTKQPAPKLPKDGNQARSENLSVPTLPGLPLPELDLSAVDLDRLGAIELPSSGLPDVSLMISAKAITADCLATPADTFGAATPAQARLVAVVGGKEIPVADIPADGLTLYLDDLLAAVENHLPAEAKDAVGQILAAIPADQLEAVKVVDVKVGYQESKFRQISVTALGVRSAFPGLFNLEVGKVDCGVSDEPKAKLGAGAKAAFGGPREGAKVDAEAKADDTGATVAAKGDVEGKVKAEGKANGETDAVAADVAPASASSPLTTLGWGAVIAIVLAGVGLAAFKLRRLVRS